MTIAVETTTSRATTTSTTATTTTAGAETTTPAPAEGATTTNPHELAHGDGRPGSGAAAAYLARLFEEHARLVLGVCRQLLRDPSEAEDAAQQTFLSAYGSLLSGSAPRDPAAWLATIARNECRGRIRSRMREPLAELADDTAVELDDALMRTIRRGDVAALRQALVELPRQQRDAFLLREFVGLSYEELAAALSVSEPAVESLLFRARRQLRVRLEAAVASLQGALSVREWAAGLFADGGSQVSAIGKLASLPIAAKLAAAGVGAILVAGGAVALKPDHHSRAPQARHNAPPAAAQRKEQGVDRVIQPDLRAPVVLTAAKVEDRARESGSSGEDRGERGQSSGRSNVGETHEKPKDEVEQKPEHDEATPDHEEPPVAVAPPVGADEPGEPPAEEDHSGPGGGDEHERESDEGSEASSGPSDSSQSGESGSSTSGHEGGDAPDLPDDEHSGSDHSGSGDD